MRNATAAVIAPILKITGFRFSKDYRWGTTRFHRVVYALVNTVGANLKAGCNPFDQQPHGAEKKWKSRKNSQ